MVSFLVALAATFQVGVTAVPEGRYAAHFERGVAALEGGNNGAAAEAFRAAGILAPLAPLWPLYLAKAEGHTTCPPRLARDPGGPWRPVGVVQTRSITLFDYASTASETEEGTATSREGALVVASDGTLRAFDLATGATLGRAALHRGHRVAGVDVGVMGESGNGPAVISWDDLGRVALWDLPRLSLIAHLDLESENGSGAAGSSRAGVRAASVEAGLVAIARVEAKGPIRIELRRVDGDTLVGGAELDSFAGAHFATDGRRFALIGAQNSADRLIVVDAESGEVQTQLELEAPPAGTFGGAFAFHGASQVLLGWGVVDWSEPTGTGVDVYDLSIREAE